MTDPVTAAAGFEPDRYPERWAALRAVLLMTFVSAALTMDMSVMGLLIEPLKHDMGLTDPQIGVLMGAAHSIPYALCAIPMGLIVDRINRINLLTIALLLWAIAMAAMAFANDFFILVGAKIVIGIVSAALLTAPASILADSVPPERRPRAIGIWMVGQYIGAAFGYLIGGLVFDALTRDPALAHAVMGDLAPWRLCYLIFGAAALSLLPFLLATPEPSRKERRQNDLSIKAASRELLAYRGFLLPFVIASIFQVLSDSSLRTWLPPALVRLYGQTPGEFGGWIGIAVLLGGMFGATMGGWLAGKARKRGDKMVIPAVAALVIGASTCLAIMPNVPMVITFFTIGTIANSILTTVTSAIVVMRLPNELRGVVSGIFILVSVGPGLALGSSLVPAMTALLGGPQTLGLAMAAIGVPTAIIAAYFFMKVRFDDPANDFAAADPSATDVAVAAART